MDDFALAAPAVISIQERRTAEGLDRHIPIILRDGILYDAALDRFFLDLPLNGVRSPHSLRAYGYDITVWVRFLHAACGKTVWAATRVDVDAFHRARRREDAGARISAASWNRSVAALEKLYRWAELEGLVGSSPFTHRQVWRRGYGNRAARVAARNDSYERAAKRSDVRFVSLEDYRVFRDVGLRGLDVDGAERPGARDRNGARNALFVCSSRRPCFSEHFGGATAAKVPVFVVSFRKNRRQTSNLSTLPGSTDAALAVKTERLPPYGLPPITAWR